MAKYGPNDVEQYLNDQLPRYEKALRRLVKIFTDELGQPPVISYQIIAWPIKGRYGIYLSGWKDHLGLHGGHYLEPLADLYPQWFKRNGATLHFQDEPELPVEVIRAVIAARIASMPEELRG
jgi:hypothetical protein